jgi:hypothetical protein
MGGCKRKHKGLTRSMSLATRQIASEHGRSQRCVEAMMLVDLGT